MEDIKDIKEYLIQLPDWEKIDLWNSWAGDHDSIEIFYNNEEFYETFIPQSTDLVDKIHDGQYKTQDKFVFFDKYGLISTCEYIDDDISPFDIEQLASYIYANQDLFGEFFEEIKKYKKNKQKNE